MCDLMFDIHIHCKVITTIKLIKILITSQGYLCVSAHVCGEDT